MDVYFLDKTSGGYAGDYTVVYKKIKYSLLAPLWFRPIIEQLRFFAASELIETIATKDDILGEFGSLRSDMRKNHKEIIWWMFFFAVTQVMANGFLFYFLLNR